MSMLKPSVIAGSLVIVVGAVAGVSTMGVSEVDKPDVVLAQANPKQAPVEKSGKTDKPDKSGRNVHVDAPTTTVDVGKDTGKVRVKAPHTDVKVDPKGQVRVRAPYVDVHVRW